MIVAHAHIDDELVLGLVEGRLDEPSLAAVDDHLDTCESCRDLVALVARTRGDRTLIPGTRLGRYVIDEVLGEGAMGRVYRAHEPTLDRDVAIKVLRDLGQAKSGGRETESARERIVSEAQAMAKLAHPNVVGVHEVGETDDGVFVVMELVDGIALDAWAPGKTWREIARALVDVARGLAAVHAAGVVHRDIKPPNLIVGRDRVLVGDFGLASEAPTGFAGTPAYMAPEVLARAPATAASDQYAFGVTAYELLAGKRPGDPIAKLDAPAWLDALVRRCLAKDPAARWPGMSELADRLDARLAARSPIAWLAGIAAVAVLASGVTFLGVRSRGEGSEAPLAACALPSIELSAQQRAELQSFEPRVLDAVDRWSTQWAQEKITGCDQPAVAACLAARGDELHALVDQAGQSIDPVVGARLVDALDALPPRECASARPDGMDPLPLDPARYADARAASHALVAARASLALGVAPANIDAIVTQARGADHQPTLGEALLVAAESARLAGKLPVAAELARDAVGAALRGRADDTFARAWITRVAIAGDRRDLAAAEDLAATAGPAIDRAGAPPRLVAQLLRLRALLAYNRGAYREAMQLLGDARAKHPLDARTSEVSQLETALGTTARATGDLDLAERHHRAALAIDRALRGERHPDVARDLHNLAGVIRLRDDLDGATALYREALAIEEAMSNPIAAALTHNSLGLVAIARADWATAKTEIAAAHAGFTATGHGDLAFAEHNLGIIAAATTDHRRALEHYAKAATLYAKTVGDANPTAARLELDRARSLLALRQLPAARTELTKASRSNVDWVATDARALLETITPTPLPPRPPPAPAEVIQQKRDVGVYGSSQGW